MRNILLTVILGASSLANAAENVDCTADVVICDAVDAEGYIVCRDGTGNQVTYKDGAEIKWEKIPYQGVETFNFPGE